MWHVSNEYGGECHCDQCQHAFRDWLKRSTTMILNL
ncbi:beta-galactosidase [Bacillus licheniformis]|nr:beta-galactosidase [Bacillus licheniformis]